MPALLALAIVLPPGLNLLQYWLHNPLYGYGIWVPFLTLVLLWQRSTNPCAEEPPKGRGLTTLLIGAYFLSLPVLRLVQIANPDWRLLDWLLAGGAIVALLALAYRVGGKPMLRRYWFPILFLLSAVPWSTTADRAFTQMAVPATARVASEIAWSLGVPSVSKGATIHTTLGPLAVSEDCSGIRSLHLSMMIALFWGGYFRLRNLRAIGLFGGALALAVTFNLMRVVALVVGTVWSGKLESVERLHDVAGVVGQILLTVAVPLFAWWFRPKSAPERPLEREVALPIWPGVSLRAGVGAVCWLLVTELASHGWYWLHESGSHSPATQWTFNQKFLPAEATSKPVPTVIQENYRYSDARYLEWNDPLKMHWSVSWLNFDKGAQSACTHNVHRPDVCLPAHDYAADQPFPDLVLPFTGDKLAFHHQSYRRNGEWLHLFFATLQDISVLGQQTAANWTFEGRLRAAQAGLRSQGSQMVHLTVINPRSPQEARAAALIYLGQLLVPRQSAPQAPIASVR